MTKRVLIIVLFSLCICAPGAFAEVPFFMNHQGTLLDSLGNPLNGVYTLTFGIYDVPELGSSLWSESHDIEFVDGLYKVTLGTVTPFPDTLFEQPNCWLEISLMGEILLPRMQIVSVPYGIKSGSAEFAYQSEFAGHSDHSNHATWADTAEWAIFTEPDADWEIAAENIFHIEGNVGIGTAGPTEKLQVVGVIHSDSGGFRFPDGSLQETAAAGGGLELPYDGSISTTNPAFSVTNTGNGIAIRGCAHDSISSFNQGGYFEAKGTDGRGVSGLSSGLRGIGTYGASHGDSGYAVYGVAHGQGGVGVGSYSQYGNAFVGTSLSANVGVSAVYGENIGSGDGVYGYSLNRNGLKGITYSSNGTHAAIYGHNYGEGLGVYAKATGSSGIGVKGESDYSHGVVGWTGATGANGVYGWSYYGVGVNGRSDSNDGLLGWTGDVDHSGVYGHSSVGVGVTGRCSGDNHGIFGATWSDSTSHGALYGINHGYGPGVYGMGANRGVYGLCTGSYSYGVHGKATGVAAYGGYFEASTSQGTGIFAKGATDGNAAEFWGNVEIISLSTFETIMELGEGLDYAEGFDVSDDIEIEPGTVLIIDPEHPGELTVSTQPYDAKVAGIVAGANGLGSAVRVAPGQFVIDITGNHLLVMHTIHSLPLNEVLLMFP